VAQSVQEFVGKTLDEAPITKIHIWVIALVSAGYFVDVLDLIVLGAIIPDMVASKFASQSEAAIVGSATLIGVFIGSVGQGEFTDRLGRRAIYQFNLLLFGIFTILGALAPNLILLAACRFVAGIGLGAEQPLCWAYAGEYAPKNIRGRILAIVHFFGGALVWPVAFLLPLVFQDTLGWRGIWLVIGITAIVVFAFRFTLPESPRWLATHGKGDAALAILKRMGLPGPMEPLTTDAASNTMSDPVLVVFRQFPVRVIAGIVCFTTYYGFGVSVGTWLPSMLNSQGFTITKSLTYTFGMTLAVPCASLFLMYALDNIGRKKTAVAAYIGAGIMAIAFASAQSDVQILVAGFIMIFLYQVAGNAMQIFASEVFPTNARASGFGMAVGVARLMTAWMLPTVLWIQTGYGIPTVFVCIAVVLLIAAYSVSKLGPEVKRLGLDEVTPPTG
jgi:putative MFS transporter